MLLSRIKLIALLVCLSFEWTKARECTNCVPLRNCKIALELSKSPDNIGRLRKSSCGNPILFLVCCSDFDQPSPKQKGPSFLSRMNKIGQDGAIVKKEVSAHVHGYRVTESSNVPYLPNKNRQSTSTIGYEETKVKKEINQSINQEESTAESGNSVETRQHPSIRLLPNSCGEIASYRIIGGQITDLYEFPWMAIISFSKGSHNYFGCSGTLINNRYVLTAAHCVVGLNIKGVRIGEYDLRSVIDCSKGVCERHPQDRRVEQAIVHEQYEGVKNNYEHDIALLRLKPSIDLNKKNAGTVCLPINQQLRQKSITGQNATVTGWGLTEHLKDSSLLLKVVIPVRPKDDCDLSYSKIAPSQLCAGIKNRDSCQGDSGGPLMIEDMYGETFRYVQYGIVSNGGRCGTSAPGLYTDIRKYIDWILNNIKE